MKANKAYQTALRNLNAFMMKHGLTVEAYYRATKRLVKQGLTKAQFQKEHFALRNGAEFKTVMDEHVRLVRIKDEMRKKSLTAEDHPLYTDPRPMGERELPWWRVAVDEKNFDMSAAKTMKEKNKVAENMDRLDHHDAIARATRQRIDREREERVRRQHEEIGAPVSDEGGNYLSLPGLHQCAECHRIGYEGQIKHRANCTTLPENAGNIPTEVIQTGAIDTVEAVA